MLPAVYPILAGASEVTALVGSPPRCYRHGKAPQRVGLPYITWSTTGRPENALDGTPSVDENTVTITAWSDDDQEVEDLAEAIRDAVEVSHHMISYGPTGRDPETMRYRISLTFTFWTDRP